MTYNVNSKGVLMMWHFGRWIVECRVRRNRFRTRTAI